MNQQKKSQAVGLLIQYKKELEAELECVKLSIDLFSKPHLHPAEKAPEEMPLFPFSLQDAIEDFLRTRSDQAFKAGAIKKWLVGQGVPGSEKYTFDSHVHSSVRRLVAQGKVIMDHRTEGNRKKKVAYFTGNFRSETK